MIQPADSACHRYRDDLLEFADHRDPSAVDGAALEHLDRCPTCRPEVEAAALAVVWLRRLAADTGRAEPPDDTWPRLRTRIARRPARWRWRAPLAGLLVSAGLVAVALAPAAYLRPPAPYIQEAGLETSIFDARRAAEDRLELGILQQQLATRTQPITYAEPAAAPEGIDATWFGPDGLRTSRAVAAPVAVQPRHE